MNITNYLVKKFIIAIILIIALIVPYQLHANNTMDLNLSLNQDIKNRGFYIGDVNNDGLNELVLLHTTTKTTVGIYSCKLEELTLLSEISFDENPQTVVIADPDKDGRNELIVGTRIGDTGGGYIYVGEFLNGQFILEWKSPNIDSFRRNTELAVGDVNGNGRNEIIAGVLWSMLLT